MRFATNNDEAGGRQKIYDNLDYCTGTVLHHRSYNHYLNDRGKLDSVPNLIPPAETLETSCCILEFEKAYELHYETSILTSTPKKRNMRLLTHNYMQSTVKG